jgi:hypothetical protein
MRAVGRAYSDLADIASELAEAGALGWVHLADSSGFAHVVTAVLEVDVSFSRSLLDPGGSSTLDSGTAGMGRPQGGSTPDGGDVESTNTPRDDCELRPGGQLGRGRDRARGTCPLLTLVHVCLGARDPQRCGY